MATTSAPAPLPTMPVKPRRRWLRGAFLLLVIGISVCAAYWWYSSYVTRRAWEEAEAEAALDLPRWKLFELEADRPDIPDAENSALFMMALRAKTGAFSVGSATNYDKIFENLPQNAQLNSQQDKLIRERLKIIAKEVEQARKLKDMPHGRLPITYSDDGFGTLLPNHQEIRMISEWLQHAAWLQAQDADMDTAVESCQAIIVGSRVFLTEPTLIGFLVRCAKRNVGLHALERVLAQGEASEEALKALQSALDREINSSSWLQAVRGERAMANRFFEAIRDGKVKSGWTNFFGGASRQNLSEGAQLWLADHLPSAILKHYPAYLRSNNRLVEIAKLPIHERLPKIKEWDTATRESRNPVIKLLTPGLERCHAAECRIQVSLRAAMVALACERYRLKDKNKAWPASLEVLVQEKLLDSIPNDPFDDQPMRYRRTKEGVVIYSIAFNMKDDLGDVERNRVEGGEAPDLGFRLWNVDRRRQAALPAVVFQD